MKPIIISHSDSSAGAYRAAVRVFQALRASNIDTVMYVMQKTTDNYFIEDLGDRKKKVINIIKNLLANQVQKLQKSSNPILHSGNWFGSPLLKKINSSDGSIVNLHWFNAETLSIKQVASIKKPIVMTLHDMWGFCGGEHYVDDSSHARFREGYNQNNKILGNSGVDLDKIIWQRKMKYWTKPFYIVTPSKWLSQCAAESKLFSDWPIYTIPNVINTQLYQPINKQICREILNLPQDIPLIGFGAVTGTNDPRKGFDLLLDAINHISDSNQLPNLACVVVGQSKPIQNLSINIPIHYMGYLNDEVSMALFYNAIDVMVVPSRQESFGQTASEPQACGTPVVAFNCTGLSDTVVHNYTGYLAKAYDTEDLAYGIKAILSDQDSYKQMQENARSRAVKLWSQEVVAEQYNNIYHQALTTY